MPQTLHILPRFLKACTHCSLTPCALWLVALITTTNLTAQPVVDTIRANPAAVELRAVWSIGGAGNDGVGDAVGWVPDLNGDGIPEVVVGYATANQFRIFYGGSPISSKPVVIFNGSGFILNGNFFGDGKSFIGYARGFIENVNGSSRFVFRFFVVKPDTVTVNIETNPLAVLDWRKMGLIDTGPTAVYAYDLDQDGADELIVMDELTIWIYRGGPGFQLDSPTITLHNDVRQNVGNGIASTYVGRLEKGMRPGIVTRYIYSDTQTILKIWYGDNSTTPWSWDTSKPGRSVIFGGRRMAVLDCDGDSVADLAVWDRENNPNTALFLSGTKKSIRTRTIDSTDTDRVLWGTPVMTSYGYLSDSLKRYEMLGVLRTIMLGLGGGRNGPDELYDMFTYQLTIVGAHTAIPDVTGDGWNDYIAGASGGAGIAVVYAGGPYIPRDPSVSLREIAVTGEDKPKLFCWPVPMHTELNIAWHGNMKRFPAHFEVHDATGRLVAIGNVEPYKGSAVWQAGSGITPGTYILSVYDSHGILLGTQKILKM